MNNDTFLLNWLLNTLDKPIFRESLGLFITILVCTAFFVGLAIVFWVKDGYFKELATAVAILLTIMAVFDGYWYFSGRKAYLQKSQEYQTKYATIVEQNKQMLETRKTYTIYLNGTQVEYDKVQFSQYEVSIDDTNHIIYLAS